MTNSYEFTNKALYAHTSRYGGEWERLEAHLKNVSGLCAEFLAPIEQRETGALLGLVHDLGKADELFQQVLRGQRTRVNHALAGAAILLKSLGPNTRVGRTLAMAVACHHSGLDSSAVRTAEALYTTGVEKDADHRDIALCDNHQLAEAVNWLQQVLPGALKRPSPLPAPSAKDETEGDRDVLYVSQISEMLLTRMLYSGLIDADWSATAEYDEPGYLITHTGRPLDADAALERLLAIRREKQRSGQTQGGKTSTLNKLRDALFDHSLRAGEGEPGLYTLTAPTGMGKTLALMAFALRHCQAQNKRRIVILLPWLTLAEQNTEEYRRVFPRDGELIEIHSAAYTPSDGEEPESEAARLRLHALAERWSAPCVVTTVVSFFEPLFSDQARACRHLHQLADSVIILDEAQSLPHGLLRATLLCVKELVEQYRCTVLFSTATQPRFDRLPGMATRWQPKEIVENPSALAEAARRVRYDFCIGDSALSRDELVERMLASPQALMIVNTRAVARFMFDALRQARDEGVYLLSANLCMAHRRAVLDEVRNRLDAGAPTLLVATSCIEAGVDISFPVLLRQMAPLESVIQAAGRCNRNGISPDGRVTVFEFSDDRDNRFPGTHYEACAKTLKALWMEDPSLDCGDLNLIDLYDTRIFRDLHDKPALVNAIKGKDYSEVSRQYRMIDNYGVNVIVPYDPDAFARLRDIADSEGLTPALIARARPYTVNASLKRVEDVACPIPLRGDPATRTEWYLLGDSSRYDIDTGCGLIDGEDIMMI